MKDKLIKIISLLFIYSLPVLSQVNALPYIKVTTPNGGEKWEAYSTQTITWESSNISNVKLEYSYSNGLSWNVIAPSVDASLGKYSWTIPNSQVSQVLIRILDASNPFVNDVSDKWFTIFKTPESKETQSLNKTTTLTSSTSVKIMPLGDSITEGVGDDPRNVAYRKDLFDALTAAGYNFRLVGLVESGLENLYPPGPDISDPNYDFYFNGRHHEGHGGWVADGDPFNSIEDNVTSWLTTLKNNVPSDEPDIILLHAGTNDCYSDNPSTIKGDIRLILDNIHNFNSNIMSIFATLIFYSHNDQTIHNHPPDYTDTLDNRFTIAEQDNLNNTLLPTEATNLISMGRNVSLVDMNSVLSQNEYPTDFSQHRIEDPSPPDFSDVHPNTSGYTAMANAWFNKLTTILPILQLKVFLQGPYAGGGSMTTTINGIIPATSPYQDVNNNSQYLNGTNHVVVPYSIPTNITDWVQIEIRNNNTTTVVESKSCFLRDDGQVIDPDGSTENISLGIIPDDYYIVVKHRNHLAVMSSDVVQLNGLTSYDFTTSITISGDQFYGGSAGAKEIEPNVWGMMSGDGNGNGQVQNNDSEDIWKPDNGTAGYKNSDFNLNGQVQNNDNEDYWKPNNGRGSQVPNI